MPGYQPGPAGWPSGPGAAGGPPGYPVLPRRPSGLATAMAAPGLAASVALSAGVGLLFLANLFVALGAQNGTPGRDRLLQFLSPADLAVGAVMVLAVALARWHREPVGSTEPPHPPESYPAPTRGVALAAGVVAAAVAVAALLRGVVDLTIPHQHGAIKIGNLTDAVAAAVVAAAAAAWGLRARR